MNSAVTDGLPAVPVRWRQSFAVIAALHIAGIWAALSWLHAVGQTPPPAPPAVLIDLPPLPMARPAPRREIQPVPKREVAKPRPPEPVAKPVLPRALPAAVAHVAVPLPATVPERPVVHEPSKVVPDEQPPAPVATAVPVAEAPPVPTVVVTRAAAVAAAPPSNAVPNWQGALLARLERFKRYPSSAQFKRQQGVAYVRFTMDRRGKVLSAVIDRSSGFSALDDEAIALMHRAEPLPPPPPEIPGDSIERVVPVNFFL